MKPKAGWHRTANSIFTQELVQVPEDGTTMPSASGTHSYIADRIEQWPIFVIFQLQVGRSVISLNELDHQSLPGRPPLWRDSSTRSLRADEGFLSEFLSVLVRKGFCQPSGWLEVLYLEGLSWSEWSDSNTRPPRPERGALPDCATLRDQRGFV